VPGDRRLVHAQSSASATTAAAARGTAAATAGDSA
jgi:hypothetical protein